MKTVQICVAEPTGDQQVEPTTIEISQTLPTLEEGLRSREELAERAQVFGREAIAIEEALHNSLPGGTYSMLLNKMLLRRASHFVVSFGEGK